MKRLVNGQSGFKKVVFKVFQPSGKREVKTIRADNGRAFAPATIEKMVVDACSQVEKTFPEHTFNLVPLGPAEFNIVCRTSNEAAQSLG